MYYDLNVCIPAHSRARAIETLQKLGYSVIAFTTVISGQTKLTPDQLPPVNKSHTTSQQQHHQSRFHTNPSNRTSKLIVLHRATIVINDISELALLSNPELSRFDLVAVTPHSEKLFQQCLQFDFDIISLPLEKRLYYHLKRSQVHVAIEKGILFELCYTPLLHDTTTRRALISNASSLTRVAPSSQLLFSSAATHPMDLRAPHDVCNLATLFSIPAHETIATVSQQPRHAVTHGNVRSVSHRGILVIKPKQQEEKEKEGLMVE